MKIKNIIAKIKAFKENHRMLNDFRFGDASKYLNSGDLLYPALCMDINPTDSNEKDREAIYSFSFWVFDMISTAAGAESNEVDLISDNTEIALDLISYLKSNINQELWMILEDSVKIDYSIGVDLDNCLSAKFDLSFKIEHLYNYSEIAKID